MMIFIIEKNLASSKRVLSVGFIRKKSISIICSFSVDSSLQQFHQLDLDIGRMKFYVHFFLSESIH